MTRPGRPLRFLAMVALGWVGMRVALLWPETGSLPAAIRALSPIRPAIASVAPAAFPAPAASAVTALPARPPAAMHWSAPPARVRAIDADRVQAAMLAMLQFGDPECIDGPPVFVRASLPVAAQTRIAPMVSRWSGGAWLVGRPGSGLGAAPGGQLGGGQMGARIAYLLDSRRRIALFARLVSPLTGRGREAAAGVEWQPSRLPVRLVAERRLGLDDGRSATGIGLVAGTDSAIPLGFRLESYGQAGIIARERVEPYADGAARATRIVNRQGGMRLSLGLGAWGAAQRDAARLDLGPSATLALPMGARQLRLALDWRERVAGDARPGSGLALTIGSDF